MVFDTRSVFGRRVCLGTRDVVCDDVELLASIESTMSIFMTDTPNHALLVPRQARDEGIGVTPLKLVIVTQWVRRRKPTNPNRPKASHRVGSRTEVRPSRDGVRSRGEVRTQAAELNPEKCIVVDRG